MISRRTSKGVVALLVAMTAVVMVVPAVGAEPVYVETGVLRLHLGAGPGDDYIQFNTLRQDLAPSTSTNCQLKSFGDNLVTFSATGSAGKQPFPGIKDERIGVGQKGEGNGEPCARINKDLNQTLTLTLGTALAGQKASYAEIDLGFKFNGTANIKAYDGTNLKFNENFECGNSSDCGPDSGSDDNKRVIFGTPPGTQPLFVFDRLVISVASPAAGSVSLEGGASELDRGDLGTALGTSDTLFQIVQQAFTISGTKFHDRDSDGKADTVEEPLEGWTISAYRQSDGSFVTSDETDENGNYELEVGVGTFIVCEAQEEATAPFGWKQTFPNPTTPNVVNCSTVTLPTGAEPLSPYGHTVPVNADVVGIDFRNVRGVTIGCGDTVTLDEEGKPSATVTVPSAGCESVDQFMVFDVGVGPNEAHVSQFVVFGGDPSGTVVLTQTINWQPEVADYDGDGNLIVPPTLVVADPGGLPGVDGTPGPVCGTNQPSSEVPDCRASRTINEGGSVPAGKIQVTEVWKFLGDPNRAR